MGHRNTHLSIGLAGNLHLHKPSMPQLISLARVCKWAIESEDLPKIDGVDKIKGHIDWYPTVCPGWLDEGEAKPSGEWKSCFYSLLRKMLV